MLLLLTGEAVPEELFHRGRGARAESSGIDRGPPAPYLYVQGRKLRPWAMVLGWKIERSCQGRWEQIKTIDSLPSRPLKAARSYRTAKGEAEGTRSHSWASRKAETHLII
jgi:hypothetical protein